MDMNNPRKRSFSSSGLPQGLDRIRKRKKKPSKSKLKGAASAPAEDARPLAAPESPKLSKPKSSKPKKGAEKKKPRSNSGLDATDAQRPTTAHSLKRARASSPHDERHPQPKTKSSKPKKNPSESSISIKPGSEAQSIYEGLSKGQKERLRKRLKKAREAATPDVKDAAPGETAGSGMSTALPAAKVSKQRKIKKAATTTMTEPSNGLASEDYHMNWDDIEQSAAQHLRDKGVDWDKISPEQRKQLEERYIGRPSMTPAIESTIHHNRSATDTPDGSSSGSASESSDNSDEGIAVSALAETPAVKSVVALHEETNEALEDNSSSSESDSDSGDGSDHDDTPPVAAARTSTTSVGARVPSEPSSPDAPEATVRQESPQQPPAISLQSPQPDWQSTREHLPASSYITGRGTLKPLQERGPSTMPRTNVKQGSLTDTQAKFQRLTAALRRGKDGDSSDESSSSSESESDDEPAPKPVMRGSIAESFADRMPTLPKEPDAGKSASDTTSSDEDMATAQEVDVQPASPKAPVAAESAEDMPADIEIDAALHGTTAAVLKDLPDATAEDSSSASSSSEESSDEDEPEAVGQARAATTAPLSTAQDNIPASDDSSDEDGNDQGGGVDLSPYVAKSALLADVSDKEDSDDRSAISDVADGDAEMIDIPELATHDDPAVPAELRSPSVSSSSSEEDSEDELEAAAQAEPATNTEMLVPQQDEARTSSNASEDNASDAEDDSDDDKPLLTKPVAEPTTENSMAGLSTKTIADASEEESSGSGSDPSGDEAAANQDSPPVHKVTEADDLDQAVSEHDSDLESGDENETGEANESDALQEEADDAPDFILNENGEIVLAPAASVADNAVSDNEEIDNAAGGAELDAEEEMPDDADEMEVDDQNGNDDIDEVGGVAGEEESDREELRDEVIDEVASADQERDNEQADDGSVNEELDTKERDDGHELMDFGATEPNSAVTEDMAAADTDDDETSSDPASVDEEEDQTDGVLAVVSVGGEEEPTTVVQSAEETSQTQLTASQRQQAAGTRRPSSHSSATANVVIKRTRMNQDRSQDLGGTKSGHSPDPPAQASNETNGVHSPPDHAPVFTEIDSQEAASLIDSVSNSVFADTRPLPDDEDSSHVLHPQVHIERKLATSSDGSARPESVKQAQPDVEHQPNGHVSTTVGKVSSAPSPKPKLDETDDEGSEDEDSDDMDIDVKMTTPKALREMRNGTIIAPGMPPELLAAMAQAMSTPQTTSAKKRKMTGNTSTHFSTPTRQKSNLAESAASDKPQRHDQPSTNGNAVASTPQPVSQKKSPAKKTGTISEHFITDRVDLYNTTAGMRRKVPAGQSANPCPPLDSPIFGIIQERTCHEPFWLVIATVFLNKTTGRQAAPTFWKIRAKWSTPAELADADYDELFDMIKHLGLQTQRTKRLKSLAAAWEAESPVAGKRYRTLHYPNKGDGKQYKPNQTIEEDADDCAGALEIAHIPGCGAYAYDSWRIFCRDVLRGVATDYLGTNATSSPFEPEWKRVLPGDKELRSCLRWMWLKEGIIWDPLTGAKRPATEEEIAKAKDGDMDFNDVMEAKFAAQAAGQDVRSPEKAVRGEAETKTPPALVVDDSFADIGIPDADIASDWALKQSQASAPAATQDDDDDDDDIMKVPARSKAKPKARTTKMAQVQVTRLEGKPANVGRATRAAKRTRSPSVEIDEVKSSPVVQKTKASVARRKKAKTSGPVIDSDGLV